MAEAPDTRTAEAFAQSWNRIGSVYTRDEFLDWFAPIGTDDLRGRDVLELGFGNGSMLYWVVQCHPRELTGIELGDTIEQTRRNLDAAGADVPVELLRGDLTSAQLGDFDVVYCIGVLHHLKEPEAGFRSVLRHARPGGRFHCWVYAHEGNAVVRWFVDPLRRVTSRLPWWLTKYGFALPLAVPFFVAARLLNVRPLRSQTWLRRLPMAAYFSWIAPRPFRFFHHVAFDQLVTPQTRYIRRSTVEQWLTAPEIDPQSVYVIFRNANSWKFGGRRRT